MLNDRAFENARRVPPGALTFVAMNSNIADSASAYFHAWLGGKSAACPSARSDILAEIAADDTGVLDPDKPDDLWTVGEIAHRMSSHCSCSPAADGYGCEHETALAEARLDWLNEDVGSHIDKGTCDNCCWFVWESQPVTAQ